MRLAAIMAGGSGERTYSLFTAAFVVATWAVAAAVSDLGVVLSVIGATCSTAIAFIIPPLVYVRMHPAPAAGAPAEPPLLRAKRYGAVLVGCAGVVIMPTCIAATFLG